MNRRILHITLIVSVMAALYWFVLRGLNLKIRFANNIKRLAKKFPVDTVANMERIFRLETAHFKSNQFLKTYSPGMEAFSTSYPYGWNTLHRILWTFDRTLAPIGRKAFTENKTGKKKYFLIFPSLYAAMFTVCTFLEHYGAQNPGRWYSLNTTSQQQYNAVIKKINPELTQKNYA